MTTLQNDNLTKQQIVKMPTVCKMAIWQNTNLITNWQNDNSTKKQVWWIDNFMKLQVNKMLRLQKSNLTKWHVVYKVSW